ncbi:hypothetical protein KKG83_05875 [Candidatus Micrarchaeota archaeon]|nr:hypothetical protein [Candidatus Micrarchaeota archaeon]MBU2476971.1 hypothetical protein [Candidatus Micrarchaeota archaeon]
MKRKNAPKTKRKKGSAYYAERVKRKINERKQAFLSHLQPKLGQESLWRQFSKNYFFYDKCFKIGFGRSLLDVLKKLPKSKRQPLRIMEDGAGNGNCLASIKERLAKLGISTETTALSLTALPELAEKKQTGTIDNVLVGLAEGFVPKKPVDVIISLNGSIHTTMPHIKKDHLLKFAHSLKKGGIMLIRFAEPKGLSREPNENRRISVLNEARGIERAFDKRGFEAKFHYVPKSLYLDFDGPALRTDYISFDEVGQKLSDHGLKEAVKIEQLKNLTFKQLAFKQAVNPAFILTVRRVK